MRIDAKPVAELRSALAQPQPELTASCDSPAEIPEGPMAAGPAERSWIQDRIALVACGDRHAALRRFYEVRDAGLAGSNGH